MLSNGHGSMLLYSLLHLTGYDAVRWSSSGISASSATRPPAIPSTSPAGPVETTTGPLGQGITNAVGMAMAEKMLAAQFNRPGHDIVDHKTWVFLGDGCLMEGISHEACSLAGTLKLGKLICFYDDNNISIDGEVDAWFTDDTAKRFEAYGWQVIDNVDGHDSAAIAAAIEQGVADERAPNADLLQDDHRLRRAEQAGHGGDPRRAAGRRGSSRRAQAARLDSLRRSRFPRILPRHGMPRARRRRRTRLERNVRRVQQRVPGARRGIYAPHGRQVAGRLAAYADKAIADIDAAAQDMATRKASLVALNAFAPVLPELVGGSADLTGSNLTKHDGSTPISGDDASGNYIWFGVREFGMTAICNGLALHGGVIPYSGTFLTFSDYARNALRMAALMKIQNILVYTHDSIGLGEDGPTHQPVEHTASLRLMPNMSVWRPCDTVETAVAWRHAIERRDGPTSLVLTRQGLPFQARTAEQIANVTRGGYVLRDTAGTPDIVLIATGSEVALAVAAAEVLQRDGVKARVVSMPCTDVFDGQDDTYRESVLPASVSARVAIEAGVTECWWRYVGSNGRVIGLDRFGASAPADELFEYFGFTTDNVVAVAKDVLN